MPNQRPFIVIVPGASQNPSHYGLLSHLLLQAGYPVLSALLPSVGATDQVSIQDDADYIRNRMMLPVLDYEERDVVLVMHSYSSAPGSAAANGLGRAERAAQGKRTAVIGQICVAALIPRGGDGSDLSGTFGGEYPPHIRADLPANLLRCDDRSLLYSGVTEVLKEAVAASGVAQGMTSFVTPLPRASWDSDDFKGRVAFIRAVNDPAIPLAVQQMMLDESGVEWIVKDIESGHSPQVSQPAKLAEMLIALTKTFESL
ncbi:Alpha/beta hydrolase fold-1 [Paraphoma chrysanthemicola]|uniref:Alpha/beta hydrolase fold-1 n=1 Tax=Paraphoma chrysanthemicola TaxID=798071 RepID=A0A8K0RB77_9PLEO|nr:Alpha/beta hydrolase fold-1 [Paraphoma chrysanthemicola]